MNSQIKEIFYNVYKFMKQKEEWEPLLPNYIKIRVAEVTVISQSSVQGILKEWSTLLQKENHSVCHKCKELK
jgi:hypothetical protein